MKLLFQTAATKLNEAKADTKEKNNGKADTKEREVNAAKVVGGVDDCEEVGILPASLQARKSVKVGTTF